jgi:hypothetical protein
MMGYYERRAPEHDATVHRVYKRYYEANGLAEEGGGEVLLDTQTFIAVSVRRTQ